jgi:hypothetical protein
LEKNLKSLEFFEKALHHFKKASISLKMCLKSLKYFEKSLDFLIKPSLSENVFKQSRNFYKSLKISLKMPSKLLKILHITGKSLNFSLNILKKPRILL